MPGSDIIDLIIGLVAAEALVLVFLRWKTGRGPAAIGLIFTLLAGAFLLLALRSAMSGASMGLIGLCLLASGFAHVLDIRERWRQPASRSHSEANRSSINTTLSLRVPEQKARPAEPAQTGD